jgi:hypothetical protein
MWENIYQHTLPDLINPSPIFKKNSSNGVGIYVDPRLRAICPPFRAYKCKLPCEIGKCDVEIGPRRLEITSHALVPRWV